MIMSSERLIYSSEWVIMSSFRVIKSSERIINSSERVIMSSERIIYSSERLILSSRRLINSSKRLNCAFLLATQGNEQNSDPYVKVLKYAEKYHNFISATWILGANKANILWAFLSINTLAWRSNLRFLTAFERLNMLSFHILLMPCIPIRCVIASKFDYFVI